MTSVTKLYEWYLKAIVSPYKGPKLDGKNPGPKCAINLIVSEEDTWLYCG